METLKSESIYNLTKLDNFSLSIQGISTRRLAFDLYAISSIYEIVNY